MQATEKYGLFQCVVTLDHPDTLTDPDYKTRRIEHELATRDGITKEFVEKLSWNTCRPTHETDTKITYEAEANIVWE